MRKWLIVAVIYLLLPWGMSLVWMRAAGAERAVREEEKEVLSVLSEDAGRTLPGENAGEPENARALPREASAEVGSAPERHILVERQNLRTYMSLEDYLPGVIACQIDPDYQMEALKCQAVIARTYICRLMEGRMEIHEEELDLDYLGAIDQDIFVNPKKRERILERLERCEQAVQETRGLVMREREGGEGQENTGGRYILPLFHSMSAGRTRGGEADFPYLQAVESSWDTERADFLNVTDWSMKEFAAGISQITDGGQVSADQLPGQIQIVKKDASGYVEQIKIGARTYSGEEVQYALGLPSACYRLEVVKCGERGSDQTLEADSAENGLLSGGIGQKIRVIARGSGHGYGLSQAGADSMAAEGWRCEDILNYYYKNISLTAE